MIFNYEGLYFEILNIARYRHENGDYFVKGRPFSAFSFRTDGVGDFEIGDKTFRSKTNEISFIPAEIPYKVKYSGGESIVVHFSSCNYVEAENISVKNAASLEMLFLGLLDSWNEKRSVNQAKAYIYNIFSELEVYDSESSRDPAFAECIGYLRANCFDADLDISDVYKRGYISASTFGRAFHRNFGTSPKQYLTKLRMDRALELLSEGKHAIKDVAMSCGFTDEKYFSRAFKKRFGYPPSHIRGKMTV